MVVSEAVAAQVAPGVLFKVAGVEGTAEAGLEVAQQGVVPPELRQVVGMLAAGDDSLVVAVGCGHRAEAGQSIGENMAAGSEVAYGPVEITAELKPFTAVILA